MRTVSLELSKQLKEKTTERFMKYVQKQDNGCWLWIGGKNSWGYGNFYFDHKTYKAHRFSWLLFKGKIPELHFDHLCRDRACVNPEHLEPVTNQVNIARGILAEVQRKRHLAITHCPKGHEYTPENTKLYKGRRFCRECALKASRESNRRAYEHGYREGIHEGYNQKMTELSPSEEKLPKEEQFKPGTRSYTEIEKIIKKIRKLEEEK